MPSASPSPGPSQPEAALILQARRDERLRLARLLHDSVAQSLTGAYLQAMVTQQQLQKDGVPAAKNVAELADMIHRTVTELREISRQLHAEEITTPPVGDR